MDILKQCAACGSRNVAIFEGREMSISCKEFTKVVPNLSGVECLDPECGECVFLGDSGQRYSQAGDECVAEFRADRTAKYWEAIKVLDLKGKKIVPWHLQARMSSDNPKVMEAVVFILDMLVNQQALMSDILSFKKQ